MLHDPMFFLSKASTLAEAIDMQLDDLNAEYKKTNDLAIKEKFSALEQYKKSIFNKTLIASHRTEFNALYSVLDKGIPGMTFSLDGNKKAYKSFWEKLEMQQEKHHSVDSLYKDIHRFRCIIFNSNTDNQETIGMLYRASLICIEYFLSKGYILCKPGNLHNTGEFNQEKHPDVWVPNSSSLPEEYAYRVKDYVANPKDNGYQSIHLLFSKGNDMFEVQLRTFAMHVRAEFKNAAHEKFKKNTRKVDNWNLSKISINGFQFVEVKDENDNIILSELLDNVGIINPVETFVRRKTF